MTRAPDYEGPAARVWRAQLAPNVAGPADWDATLGVWVAEMKPPWDTVTSSVGMAVLPAGLVISPPPGDRRFVAQFPYPRWAWFLIHLRDLPGVPPAVRSAPDRGYEIAAMAMPPGSFPADLEPELWDPRRIRVNALACKMAHQWATKIGDAGALELGAKVAELFAQGTLPLPSPNGREFEAWTSTLEGAERAALAVQA